MPASGGCVRDVIEDAHAPKKAYVLIVTHLLHFLELKLRSGGRAFGSFNALCVDNVALCCYLRSCTTGISFGSETLDTDFFVHFEDVATGLGRREARIMKIADIFGQNGFDEFVRREISRA